MNSFQWYLYRKKKWNHHTLYKILTLVLRLLLFVRFVLRFSWQFLVLFSTELKRVSFIVRLKIFFDEKSKKYVCQSRILYYQCKLWTMLSREVSVIWKIVGLFIAGCLNRAWCIILVSHFRSFVGDICRTRCQHLRSSQGFGSGYDVDRSMTTLNRLRLKIFPGSCRMLCVVRVW